LCAVGLHVTQLPAEFQGFAYELMAGKPYGEAPVFKGPFVDSFRSLHSFIIHSYYGKQIN